MLLREVVATSTAVAGTPGRKAKITELAGLLRRVPPGEIPVAVAYLSGELTQRQIGVGYAALVGLASAGPAPSGAPGPRGAAVQEEPPAGSGPARPGPDAANPRSAPPGPATGGQLTLAGTDAALGAIGALTGTGSQARRRQLLAELMGQATAAEQDFLRRLIAGDLGQGALEGIMTEAVALAAGVAAEEVRAAVQVGGSLAAVAAAALGAGASALDALRAFRLRVGEPARPMLAASAPSLDAALDRIRPAAIEWKIDGIRVQIHRSGPRVRIFSRTLDDVTARMPEIVTAALALPVEAAVLDGEAIALYADGRPRPFQATAGRAASQAPPDTAAAAAVPSAGRLPLTVFLFDLLHCDGDDLMDRPGSERFDRLAGIVPAGMLIPRLVTGDAEAAAAFFAAALAAGHEGVVVKAPEAPYRAGRRGGEWIKVKPRHTLDLVILAAEWGHGRRTGLLSNLHLGARDPETGGFVMLGKTFKGLTDKMLAWQTDRLLELAEGGPEAAAADRRPAYGVVRVRPELVAEIAFDTVQASSRYPGGVTLRFARVLRYRQDKRAEEADTIGTVRALWLHDAPAGPR